MTLATLIRTTAQQHPDEDPNVLAKRLLSQATKNEFLAILADEIAQEQRLLALAAEKSAFRAGFNGKTLIVPTADPEALEGLRALLKSPLSLYDGTKVEWGEATVEQLKQRRDALVQLRKGVDESIGRLDTAIDLLEKTGARNLNELSNA